MTDESPTAGWYPTDDHLERYWDGADWTDQSRPRMSPPAAAEVASRPTESGPQTATIVTALVLAAAVIGMIMALQGASLLTGTGNLWTGVAIAIAAAVVAFVTKAKRWVKVVVSIAAILALGNTLYVEAQLDEMRNDFGFDSLPDLSIQLE